MFQWISDLIDWIQGLTWVQALLLGLGIFLVSFFGSLASTAWMLIKLPPNYLRDDATPPLVRHHPVLRVLGLVLKNLIGIFLVFMGIILSLPGVPGQGILTILIGLMLMSFPGKRSLEKKLLGRPWVLNGVNRLRERFGHRSEERRVGKECRL